MGEGRAMAIEKPLDEALSETFPAWISEGWHCTECSEMVGLTL